MSSNVELTSPPKITTATGCRISLPGASLDSNSGSKASAATEAATLLVGWLQRQPAFVRIWATCDADNAASAAVLRKAGLQLEGRLRRATVRPNRGTAPRDTLMHAWVREDRNEDTA